MSMRSWSTHGVCVVLGLLAGAAGGAWLAQQAYGTAADRAASSASTYSTLLFDRQGHAMSPGRSRSLLEAWAQGEFLVAAAGYDQLDPLHRDLLGVAAARFALVDATRARNGTDMSDELARAARECIRTAPAAGIETCALRRHAQIMEARCSARGPDGACGGWTGAGRAAGAVDLADARENPR